MDKKRLIKTLEPDDLKGFEEFIEGQSSETSFLPKGVGGSSKKNEANFEHFTFLANDSVRLTKLKKLLSEKLPFITKFDQSQKLIEEQKTEIEIIRKKLFEVLDQNESTYKKSLREIFNSFFEPPKV
jgi:flagellar biosynthesis component FlhA